MTILSSFEYNEAFAEKIKNELNKTTSDKIICHEYHKTYSHIFEGMDVKNFLEIGLFLIYLGISDLPAWSKIFPDAKIYGADIQIDETNIYENIEMRHVDQSNIESLNRLKKELNSEFDVILDDGSHIYENTILTFKALFEIVKIGGVYLIEDIVNYEENIITWQQKVVELEKFMNENGFKYKVFESRNIKENKYSGSHIMCIYK